MKSINGLMILVIAAVAGFFFFTSSPKDQSADLGQVLDRSVFAFEQYDTAIQASGATEVSDANLDEFGNYVSDVMNSEPRFYSEPIGVSMQEDASLLGFDDTNGNRIQDEGEKDVFTVEVDSENERIIATDEAGQSAHSGFSGTGLLTGYLLGSMLSRQGAAGVRPGSFNNRATTSRASYKAPASARSSARSGGPSRGK